MVNLKYLWQSSIRVPPLLVLTTAAAQQLWNHLITPVCVLLMTLVLVLELPVWTTSTAVLQQHIQTTLQV